MSTRTRRTIGIAAAVLLVLVAGSTGFGLHLVAIAHHKAIQAATPTPPIDTSAACSVGTTQPYSTFGVQQRPNGAFRACLQVGGVSPGTYLLRLETIGKRGFLPPVASTGGWLKLSPAEGPPGTPVEMTGFVPNTTDTQRRNDHAQLCWDGCNGLLDSVQVKWSADQPGRFTSRFTVPAAAWLEATGVHPITPGTYTVGFDCIPEEFNKPQPQCLTTQIGTSFRLSGSGSSLCSSGSACALLKPDPPQAPPGTLVTVHGWAPIVGFDGGGYLELSLVAGVPPTFVKPGSGPVVLASVPFNVTAGPGWASLGSLQPVWQQRTGASAIAVDPANPRRFAYCANGAIRMTSDAGATWSAVSLAGAVRASETTDYPLVGPYSGGQVFCPSLTLDPRHPSSVYATFAAPRKEWGPPPLFFLAYVTTDAGRSWRPVPVPAGLDMGAFGGFRADSQAVRALFFAGQPPDSRAFVVEQTADGGHAWSSGSLACPPAGACVALGPQDNGRCQAVASVEDVELSYDGGATWSSPAWPRQASACQTSQLVSLGSTGLALVAGVAQFGLIVSNDAGRTWQVIALPPLPGSDPTASPSSSGLQVLPDGSLLLSGTDWYLLAQRASAWCRVAGAPALQPDDPANLPLPIGDRLWWVTPSFVDQAHSGQLQSFPLSGLRCG